MLLNPERDTPKPDSLVADHRDDHESSAGMESDQCPPTESHDDTEPTTSLITVACGMVPTTTTTVTITSDVSTSPVIATSTNSSTGLPTAPTPMGYGTCPTTKDTTEGKSYLCMSSCKKIIFMCGI